MIFGLIGLINTLVRPSFCETAVIFIDHVFKNPAILLYTRIRKIYLNRFRRFTINRLIQLVFVKKFVTPRLKLEILEADLRDRSFFMGGVGDG